MYVYMYVCVCVCMYVCVCVCIYVLMSACICVCMHVRQPLRSSASSILSRLFLLSKRTLKPSRLNTLQHATIHCTTLPRVLKLKHNLCSGFLRTPSPPFNRHPRLARPVRLFRPHPLHVRHHRSCVHQYLRACLRYCCASPVCVCSETSLCGYVYLPVSCVNESTWYVCS